MKLNMTAPCHFGLEKTLSFELRRAGAEDLNVTDGRINFTGTAETLVRVNLSCSVAERIGVVIARFRAQTFDDVFDNIKAINTGDYFSEDAAFPVVKGQSVNSKLTSIPALQRTVKKALAEAFAASSQRNDPVQPSETGAVYPVRFFLHKDEMTVFIDSSGEGLHKRGYREKSGAAPIKETLAAGIIDIAKVRAGDTIADPFCGSGTLLIEAAFKALGVPPCLNRSFIAESWSFIPSGLWSDVREELRAGIKRDTGFMAYGYDCDPECVRLTQENARKAGVEQYIKVEQREIKDFVYPAENCKVITNPPYDERMKADTALLYKQMGERLNGGVYVITSDEEFEAHFGRKANKNRKLYNGMLMCRLWVYTGD